jgi:hypothetical protein
LNGADGSAGGPGSRREVEGEAEGWAQLDERRAVERIGVRAARVDDHAESLADGLQAARAAGPVAGLLAAGDRGRRRLEDALGVGAQRPSAASEIEALLNAEERIHARVVNAFGVGAARRATTDELQWLLRRSACRGLGEPAHDPHWQPGAVLVESPDGKVAYEPRTTDLLRFATRRSWRSPARW